MFERLFPSLKCFLVWEESCRRFLLKFVPIDESYSFTVLMVIGITLNSSRSSLIHPFCVTIQANKVF